MTIAEMRSSEQEPQSPNPEVAGSSPTPLLDTGANSADNNLLGAEGLFSVVASEDAPLPNLVVDRAIPARPGDGSGSDVSSIPSVYS
jgi:hypothetical protein